MTIRFNHTVIAHRGASAYAPENTLEAFQKAYLMGAKWIEFDVMLAACGTPMVFHDETLERTTLGTGATGVHSFAYLSTLEAGAWFSPFAAGARIPSLKTVLGFLKETGLSANIEIKPLPHQDKKTTEAVLKTVYAVFGHLHVPFLYSSFSLTSLSHLRQLHPAAQIGLLMDSWLPDWEAWVARLSPVSIHLDKQLVTAKMASCIKSLDKQLLCYTVNSRQEAFDLFRLGVDGVFSDFPDLLSR